MRQFHIPSTALGLVENYKFRSYERTEYTSNLTAYEHSHSFTEIFLITSGKGVFLTKDGQTPIHKGMLIINSPGVPHTEYSSEENPLSYAVFAVENFKFSMPDSARAKTFFFDFSAHYEKLFQILAVIENEFVKKPPLWQLSIANAFNEFMLILLRNTQLVAMPYDTSANPNLPSRIQAFLHSNYQDNITLDNLSATFFLNKYYLAHTFKKKFGISIIQYLTDLRCTEAKKLLETTDLSITEIAMCVGFNSSSHFSECYKKQMGEAPAQTRRKLHETASKPKGKK